MAAAPRRMIAATDTAHDKSSGRRTALRRPSLDGNSDLQDFGARSGFDNQVADLSQRLNDLRDQVING